MRALKCRLYRMRAQLMLVVRPLMAICAVGEWYRWVCGRATCTALPRLFIILLPIVDDSGNDTNPTDRSSRRSVAYAREERWRGSSTDLVLTAVTKGHGMGRLARPRPIRTKPSQRRSQCMTALLLLTSQHPHLDALLMMLGLAPGVERCRERWEGEGRSS